MNRLPTPIYLICLSIIATGSILSSCGARVNTNEIKEYRVTLASADKSFRPLIKNLVSDYNSTLGFRALEYVDSQDQANSTILVTEGLETRDGKVGWGQWLSETERSGIDAPGGSVDKTVTYSLQVEFDADYLRQNSKLENGSLTENARKLFAHEIGHGFQLDHHPDQSNIMYFDVTGTKNWSTYWPQIHSYFGR
jgi:predicted Zn-dependent protease